MVDYSNPYVYLTTAAEILVFLTLLILNVKVYHRYKERQSKVALQLFYTFFCFGLSPALQMLDTLFLDTITEPHFDYLPSFGYAFAFLAASIGNYFLIRFTISLFGDTGSNRPNYIGILSIIMGILFVITRTAGLEISSTTIMLILILISFLIFSFLIRASIRTSINIKELPAKRGFQLMGLFGMCLILMYLFFIIEAIVGFGEFTIFASIGWLFGLFGSLCAYVGFIMPDWFKKHFQETES